MGSSDVNKDYDINVKEEGINEKRNIIIDRMRIKVSPFPPAPPGPKTTIWSGIPSVGVRLGGVVNEIKGEI